MKPCIVIRGGSEVFIAYPKYGIWKHYSILDIMSDPDQWYTPLVEVNQAPIATSFWQNWASISLNLLN